MMSIIFSHKLLLSNTQVLRFFIAFGNNSSANIKSPKTQLYKQDNREDFQVGF